MYEGLDKNTDIIEAICFVNITKNRFYSCTHPQEILEMYKIVANYWELNVKSEKHRLIIEKFIFKSIMCN